MDAATFFSGRNSLDTVSACFIRKAINVGELNYRARVPNRDTVLSGARGEIATIGSGQIAGEQLGIVTTFGGPDFKYHIRLHFSLI